MNMVWVQGRIHRRLRTLSTLNSKLRGDECRGHQQLGDVEKEIKWTKERASGEGKETYTNMIFGLHAEILTCDLGTFVAHSPEILQRTMRRL